MMGYDKLPEHIKEPILPYMDVKFDNSIYTIETASEACVEEAIANVIANGGKEVDGKVQIKLQPFKAPPGPAEVAMANLIPSDGFWVSDNRITWEGDWSEPTHIDDYRVSGDAGDYMEVKFPGTAVFVETEIKFDGGILEVSVDGEPMGTRDMFMTKKWYKYGSTPQVSAVWLTGLSDGEHTLRVTVSGEKNPESEGTLVRLGRIACYRGHIE